MRRALIIPQGAKDMLCLVTLALTSAAGLISAPRPEDAVRAVLLAQQRDWNRGDIPAFLEGYEASDRTTFVGTAISRGYAGLRARYEKRYPNRAAMGVLTFSDLEVTMLGPGYASVLGHWHLDRGREAGGPAGGYFTLLLRHGAQGWKIFLDHTSPE